MHKIVLQEGFCPITGEEIFAWQNKGGRRRWLPTKQHVQFDVLLDNGDILTLATSKNGYILAQNNPRLIGAIFVALKQQWLNNGYDARQQATIHKILWETVQMGLTVK